MTMFAYLCLGSNDLERAGRFYDATLGVLGYRRCDTSAESETSWNGYARFAVADALRRGVPLKATPDKVLKVDSSAFATAAKRPLMRSRRCEKNLEGLLTVHQARLPSLP